MTRIFLIRHGETEWNRQQIFRGISDVQLNENGREQVNALGRRFANLFLRSIYTSKLSRAMETAQAIARSQNSEKIITTDDGLTDIHYGEWAGMAYDEVRGKSPELYSKWRETPQEMRFPGGESLQSVYLRAWRSFDKIRREAEGDSVAIVSHQVVIRALLCGVFYLDLSHFWQFDPDPASITEIRLEHDNWVIYRLNDVSHLGMDLALPSRKE